MCPFLRIKFKNIDSKKKKNPINLENNLTTRLAVVYIYADCEILAWFFSYGYSRKIEEIILSIILSDCDRFLRTRQLNQLRI